MTEEYVYWVDENDNVLGKVTRREMRQKNLLHRSTATIVNNSNGDILVHKRTQTKDIFPGYHSMLVGGSVQYGESYEECARRELEEELGIRNSKPKFIFPMIRISEKDNVIWYVFKIECDGPFKFQKEEVESGSFVSVETLHKMFQHEKFPNGEKEIFDKYMREHHEA